MSINHSYHERNPDYKQNPLSQQWPYILVVYKRLTEGCHQHPSPCRAETMRARTERTLWPYIFLMYFSVTPKTDQAFSRSDLAKSHKYLAFFFFLKEKT